jgi:elongation factor Ts
MAEMITAAMVQELREATNVGMMECKRALVEAGGDKNKAIKLLRERGMAVAAKKATRAANQGLVGSFVKDDGSAGSLIEVNCETDFVARNASFQAFAKELSVEAANIDGSLAQHVAARVTAKIAEIGENIIVKRNLRFVRQGQGVIQSYIHLGGKVGVLLELNCTKPETAGAAVFRDLAKDLTLHIAASSPKYLSRTEVPADILTAEREIFAKQVEGKPAPMVEKIVDGKMGKFYQQVCLPEQIFVRDQETVISKLLELKGKELGDTLTIRRFARYQLGE